MICDLCKGEINTKKERYVHIEDYNKEKIEKEMWYHIKCFKKGMNRELTELEKNAKNMLNTAGKVFNKVVKDNPELNLNEEEYIIQ